MADSRTRIYHSICTIRDLSMLGSIRYYTPSIQMTLHLRIYSAMSGISRTHPPPNSSALPYYMLSIYTNYHNLHIHLSYTLNTTLSLYSRIYQCQFRIANIYPLLYNNSISNYTTNICTNFSISHILLSHTSHIHLMLHLRTYSTMSRISHTHLLLYDNSILYYMSSILQNLHNLNILISGRHRIVLLTCLRNSHSISHIYHILLYCNSLYSFLLGIPYTDF